MKNEEKQILIIDKENEGKSREQAYQEIKVLQSSQIEFKELKKQISKLILENMALRNQLSKFKESKSKERFKRLREAPEKEIKNNHINRILHHAEKGKWYAKTKLGKELLIKGSEMEGTLKILISLGKAEYKIEDGVCRYMIK